MVEVVSNESRDSLCVMHDTKALTIIIYIPALLADSSVFVLTLVSLVRGMKG